MRSLHKVEEKLYSPDLKLNGNEYKVLLYIRHNSIRWDKEEFEFSYGEISKHTGIDKREVRRVVNKLVELKLILKFTSAVNKVHNKNLIGLNPGYFGELVEKTCKPKFSVIDGGREEKLSTQATSVGGNETAPQGSIAPQVWGQSHPHEQGQDAPPERLSSLLKNSSKEQSKKLLREDLNFFSQEIREPTPEDLENRKRAQLRALDEYKRSEGLL